MEYYLEYFYHGLEDSCEVHTSVVGPNNPQSFGNLSFLSKRAIQPWALAFF